MEIGATGWPGHPVHQFVVQAEQEQETEAVILQHHSMVGQAALVQPLTLKFVNHVRTD